MIKFQPEHTVNIGLSCDINKLSSPISRSSNCSSLVASSSGCSSLPSSYQVYQQPTLVVAVLHLLVTRYIYQQPALEVAVLHLLVTRYIYQQPALVVAVLHLLLTRYTSSQLQWLQFSTFQLPGVLVANSSGCSSPPSSYQVYQ